MTAPAPTFRVRLRVTGIRYGSGYVGLPAAIRWARGTPVLSPSAGLGRTLDALGIDWRET